MLSKEMVQNVCGRDKHTGVRLILFTFYWDAMKEWEASVEGMETALSEGNKESYLYHFKEQRTLIREIMNYGELMGNSA